MATDWKGMEGMGGRWGADGAHNEVGIMAEAKGLRAKGVIGTARQGCRDS
jgi:hypothetical protein